MRGSYLEEAAARAITTEMFDAVLASKPHSPLDIDIRLQALESFLALPEATSLAAAN
jgi:glycyl-tRNA synthetase beta subunit